VFVTHSVASDPLFQPLVLERDPEYLLAPECPSSPPGFAERPKLVSIEALADRIAPLQINDASPSDPDEVFPSPFSSLVPKVVPPNTAASALVFPKLCDTYTTRQRERWVDTHLSDCIKVKLNDLNGKESLNQWFHAEATLRHCVLPILRRGFLDASDHAALAATSVDFQNLFQCLKEYADVDFNALCGFPTGWQSEDDINLDRVRSMASAALLHFEGDAGALAMFMGGPHCAWHRDVPAIMSLLSSVARWKMR
jgi:hypothetical protein